MVGAAGVLAELLFAAIAAVIFTLVEAGMVRDLAYTALLLGSVSTLLFNGNPLLRYDGYYVFADIIEMPNLAPLRHALLALSVTALRAATARGNEPRGYYCRTGVVMRLWRRIVRLSSADHRRHRATGGQRHPVIKKLSFINSMKC